MQAHSNYLILKEWQLGFCYDFLASKQLKKKTATATKQCVKYDGGFMSHLMSIFTPISRLFIILIINLNTFKDANQQTEMRYNYLNKKPQNYPKKYFNLNN